MIEVRRKICSIFALVFFLCTLSLNAQTSESKAHVIAGTVAPLARTASDRGEISNALELPTMQLYLVPTPSQMVALKQLLQDQQNPHSDSFHRWLTSEQFGSEFGVSSADELKIRSWLLAQGFHNITLAKSRTVMTFSGSSAQAEHAFNTRIHSFVVKGESHFGNVSNISVPNALAGLVQSVRGLDDFRPTPHVRHHPMTSQFTDASGFHYIAPGDIAAIYDFQSLYGVGVNGSGVTAAVMGQTDIDLSDFTAYRSAFGLSANNPTVVLATTSGDPGTIASDLTEADLDLELLGAVAQNAKILYVNSTNVFTSLQYAIDQNLAQVVSLSYGGCESNTPAYYQSLELLGEQANAQGMTVLAASGDAGAADCDSATETAAQYGLAVDSPASTPEFTAVGGTDFNTPDSSYFNSANGSQGGSAVSYIPEIAWNNSAALHALDASGGGASTIYPKPVWQAGQGVPNDGQRDVPDVAFYAMSANSGYLICTAGSCASGLPNPVVTGEVYGGTSAATPVFAGIVALLNNYLVTNGNIPTSGLGNINPQLYLLAEKTTDIYHDVTQGSNIVPCVANTTDCTTGSYGFEAGPGYDQVTGLGSVDTFNLVREWTSYSIVGTTLQLSGPSSPAVEGASVNLTAKIIPATGSTLPSGNVTFYANEAQISTAAIDGSGTATISVSSLSPGVNTIQAVYEGSLEFGESLSQSVAVSILTPTTTVLTASPAQVAQGSPITFTATVEGANQVPTGSVTFYSGTSQIGTATLSGGTASVSTTSLPAGSDSITATYSGSSTFASSTSSAITVDVSSSGNSTTVATTTALTASLSNGTVNMTAIVAAATGSSVPTGAVSFYNGSSLIGSAALSSGSAILASTSLPVGTDTITATYAGNATFATSTSTPVSVTVVQPAAPDFILAASSASLNVEIGKSASTTLTITPNNGFNSVLTFSCSGLPTGATCAFGTPAPQTNSSSTVAVTISTQTTTALNTSAFPNEAPLVAFLPFAGILLFKRRKLLEKYCYLGVLSIILLGSVAGITGCGGGTINTTTPSAQNQTSTSTVTITATSATGISHATQVTLTVTGN